MFVHIKKSGNPALFSFDSCCCDKCQMFFVGGAKKNPIFQCRKLFLFFAILTGHQISCRYLGEKLCLKKVPLTPRKFFNNICCFSERDLRTIWSPSLFWGVEMSFFVPSNWMKTVSFEANNYSESSRTDKHFLSCKNQLPKMFISVLGRRYMVRFESQKRYPAPEKKLLLFSDFFSHLA